MDKRPTFIDRLKAKFFRKQTVDQTTASYKKSQEINFLGSSAEVKRRGTSMLAEPPNHSHTAKSNRVQLDAIDHNLSNAKIAEIVNGLYQR
mgnify:CR=1 FL=1